jgi:hypothetical protein
MYEDYVKFSGGEVLSTQCNEDRHGECPQGPDDEETGVPPGDPVLDGYYCECDCGHE